MQVFFVMLSRVTTFLARALLKDLSRWDWQLRLRLFKQRLVTILTRQLQQVAQMMKDQQLPLMEALSAPPQLSRYSQILAYIDIYIYIYSTLLEVHLVSFSMFIPSVHM